MTPARFSGLVLARLAQVAAVLVASRWPPLSAWWEALLRRYMAKGVRQLVARVGRRGGKSSTAVVFSVAFALVYASLGLVPPGDVGYVVFVSARRDEALARLRSIELILRTLGIDFAPADGDAIVMAGTNIGFRVLSCNVASVSGWTTILACADECAKWLNADTGQNPAREVLASLRATMATQPLARMILLSSPLGTEDAHAEAFALGDTAAQIVAHAETWIANDTVTEASTRELEPDARIWAREYAAIPQASAISAFDADAIDRAFAPHDDAVIAGRRALVLDPSSGRKDAWTWGIFGTTTSGRVVFDLVDGHEGAFFAQGAGDVIVDELAALAKEHGVREVHADQRESLMLASAFHKRGFGYTVHDWTATSKPDAVARVRRWLADGLLTLPEHETLRREMGAFEERITSAGAFTFGARGNGHDDYVSLLITAAMAQLAGDLDPPMPIRMLTRARPSGFEPPLMPSDERAWPTKRGF